MLPTFTHIQVIKALGGKCAFNGCQVTDTRLLQVDHKKKQRWTGNQERLYVYPNTQQYFRHILRHKENYQVLCANHNVLKKYVEDECRRRLPDELLVERYTVLLTVKDSLLLKR